MFLVQAWECYDVCGLVMVVEQYPFEDLCVRLWTSFLGLFDVVECECGQDFDVVFYLCALWHEDDLTLLSAGVSSNLLESRKEFSREVDRVVFKECFNEIVVVEAVWFVWVRVRVVVGGAF